MKKINKWALLLIAVMLIGMLSGCKSNREEEPAVSDDWVGVVDREEEDSKDDSKEDDTSKKEEDSDKKEEQNNSSDQKDPTDDSAGKKEPEDDKNDTGKEPTPDKTPADNGGKDDQEPDEGNGGGSADEWVPVKKEDSGTAITFLSQNVKHAGYTPYGEKGDGTSANIYNRLRRFKTLVTTQDPDVIFFNEAKATAQNFFDEDPYMSQTYDYVWQHRHSSLAGHLMSEPVLYKTSEFKALETGHFWISPTPNREGPGFGGQPGADVSTWAKLQVKATGEIVYCYCLHTDPGNPEACIGALQLYYDRFAKIEKDAYAFVGGDYNCYYRTDTYNSMVEWDQIVDLRDVAMYLNQDGLCTLGGMASGHNLAFNQTGVLIPSVETPTEGGMKTEHHQIDYVMMKPHPNVCVDHYGFDYTVYDYPAEGIAKGHISDHWGLIVKVRIGTDADYSQYQAEPFEYSAEHPMWFNTAMKD